ncbi:hypothetical protein KJ068_03875 [bacterium]|nr:hypothetical protein [bacterium]
MKVLIKSCWLRPLKPRVYILLPESGENLFVSTLQPKSKSPPERVRAAIKKKISSGWKNPMDLALSVGFFYQLEKVWARFVKIYPQNVNGPGKNFSVGLHFSGRNTFGILF